MPAMAFAMPPPTSPIGNGSFVKKSRFIDAPPILTSYQTIAISGRVATTAAT